MKFFIAIVLIIVSNTMYSQVTDSIPPAPPSAGEGKGFTSVPSFIFIDLTLNNWMNTPAGIENNFFSPGINLSLLYDFKIIGSALTIAPGLSYSVVNIKNNAEYNYVVSQSGAEVIFTEVLPIPDSLNLLKNKLSTSWIAVPVELRIRTKPNERGRSCFFAPGFKAGYLAGSFRKYKYEDPFGEQRKIKDYYIKNLTSFSYGITLRIGYHKYALYGYYSLSELFEEGKGPAINPYSVGITVNPF